MNKKEKGDERERENEVGERKFKRYTHYDSRVVRSAVDGFLVVGHLQREEKKGNSHQGRKKEKDKQERKKERQRERERITSLIAVNAYQ